MKWKVEEINFNYPELMSDIAKEIITKTMEDIHTLEDEIADMHEAIRDLQKSLEEKKAMMAAINSIVSITTVATNTTTNDTSTQPSRLIAFNFNSDINKGIH